MYIVIYKVGEVINKKEGRQVIHRKKNSSILNLCIYKDGHKVLGKQGIKKLVVYIDQPILVLVLT